MGAVLANAKRLERGGDRRRGSRPTRGLAAAAVLAAAAGGTRSAAGATYAFVGDGSSATGQTWNVATHWTPNGLPGPSDTAEFDSTDDKNLAGATVDTGANQSIGQLLLGQSGRAIGQSFTVANNTIILGAATGANAVTLSRNGVGVQTVASNVSLGSVSQTWTLSNSNNATPGSVTVTGVIGEVTAGSGISKQGVGTLQLNGANTFTGVYATRGGITVIGNASALGADATTLVSDPATSADASLLTANGVTFGRNVTVLNSFNASTGSARAVTLGGNTGQTASTWTGTVTLNQASNLSGGATGTVTFSGSIVNGSGGTSPTGVGYVFGNSNVTKVDAGTVVLAGADTYTGTTTVAAGTLRANNTAGSATGTGLVTVAAGGTLGGTGTVGAVTVNGTVTAGPDANTTGTLTSTGLQTWAAGGTYLAAVAADGSTADRLLLAGGLSVPTTGSFNVSIPGTVLLGGTVVLATDPEAAATNPFAPGLSAATLAALTLVDPNVTSTTGGTPALSTQLDADGTSYDLVLTSAPEPTSMLLASVAVAPSTLGRRRRRTR